MRQLFAFQSQVGVNKGNDSHQAVGSLYYLIMIATITQVHGICIRCHVRHALTAGVITLHLAKGLCSRSYHFTDEKTDGHRGCQEISFSPNMKI